MAQVISFPVGSVLIDYYVKYGWEPFTVSDGRVYLRFVGAKK